LGAVAGSSSQVPGSPRLSLSADIGARASFALPIGSPVKLNVDNLNATPTPYSYEASADWWAERNAEVEEGPYDVIRPFAFQIEAYKVREDAYLRGEMTSEIELECGRCVARYRQPLRETFSLVLESAAGRVPADPEGAAALKRDGMCLGEEIEAGWYRGSEVQLDAYFVEIVSLGMPVQPLCRDDCLGLCPRCGTDRNLSPCSCKELADDGELETKTESPFAVLAALRDEITGTQGD
jgi:uncharacterized protein